MYRSLIAAAALLFLAGQARAENAIDCAKAVATVELNFCAEKELDKADAEMNEVYKKVLAYVAKSGGEKPYDPKSWEEALRASQRAWVAFRDAQCKGLVPMSWGGGTGTTGEVLGCMSAMTKARTKELAELYALE
jgi:uncharacterized protein YecT (DUF1311 family)